MPRFTLAVCRNMGFVCALFLLSAVNLQAVEPRININSPIDSVSYARSEQNEVLVTIKLREAKGTDPATPIGRFSLTNLSIKSDDQRVGVVNNTPREAESLDYKFLIPISTTSISSGDAIFRLAPNWKSFDFSFESVFTPVGATVSRRLASPSFTVLRNFIEPQTTKIVRATIDLPTLIDTNKVTVPVKLDDDDLVVDVELYDASNNLVARGGDFIERGNAKIITLKEDTRFPIQNGNPYQVRIKPRFRNEVNLSTKTRDWSPSGVIPKYAIVRESSPDLNNLNIVSNSDPLPFKVQTTGQGRMFMTIDGVPGEINANTSSDGVIHTFVVNATIVRGLPEGSTNFRFKGTSGQGAELAEAGQTFKLNKDTQTRLIGITGVKLDISEAEGRKILQLDYQLSRKVASQVQIDGAVSLPATFTGTDKGPYTYTAKIDINAAATLNTLQTAIARNNGGTTPVKFAIIEPKDAGLLEIGGIKVDAFAAPVVPQPKDKNTLLRLIDDASNMVKRNQTDLARAAIKTALGFASSATPSASDSQVITDVVSQLSQENNQSGKTKALAIIGSIGRVALNLFGIPVPITPPRPEGM